MILSDPLEPGVNLEQWMFTHEKYIKELWNEALMNDVDNISLTDIFDEKSLKDIDKQELKGLLKDVQLSIVCQYIACKLLDKTPDELTYDDEDGLLLNFVNILEVFLHVWNMEDKGILSIDEDGQLRLKLYED